ncbi:probable peptidoglycan muropeptide transporter SLC46 [Chironomus tepperi]|uniref:probable peptidoglycan muropeptide transporter SLC46 n=1 Tax=Chironomus tepperi TaxID=113505 RepID=UPI00391F1FFA
MDRQQPLNNDEEHEEDQEEIQTQGSANESGTYFLELGLLFLFIGNNLVQTLLQNQIIKQTCTYLGYNQSICDVINLNQNDTKDIEEKIQPYVANIDMVTTLFHTITPAILSLFLGNWSDLYGRKKVLCSTFFGYTLTLSSFAAVCFYSENIRSLSPWTYVLCYIPATISGGWPSLLTAALCYITDTVHISARSRRLTIIELIIFLGVLIGTFFCSSILTLTDGPTVFIIASVLALFGFLVIRFFVDESVPPTDVSTLEKAKNLFSPIIIVNLLKTCFKRRPFKGRRILLLLILILALTVFTFNGNSTVGYLFVREKFSWTLKQNNQFESYSIVCSLLGSVFGFAILKKVMKFSDISLTCLAIFCYILDSFLKSFATESWEMYAITSITLFKILGSPMIRTLMSTIIPHDEIGKIFSITTSFEALSTFAASPLYTIVYKSTFTTFAGAFFLITAGVNIINLLIAFYIVYLKKIRESLINPYEQIENN